MGFKIRIHTRVAIFFSLALTTTANAAGFCANKIANDGRPFLLTPQEFAFLRTNREEQISRKLLHSFKKISPEQKADGSSYFRTPTIWNVDSAETFYKATYATLTDSEKLSLAQYTNEGYLYVNALLRREILPNDVPQEKIQSILQNLNNVMSRSPALPQNLVLFRLLFLPRDVSFEVGSSIQPIGIQSTSISSHTIERMLKTQVSQIFDPKYQFIIQVILVKGKTPGYFISPDQAAFFTELGEVILPSETQFRILGIEPGEKFGLYRFPFKFMYLETETK